MTDIRILFLLAIFVFGFSFFLFEKWQAAQLASNTCESVSSQYKDACQLDQLHRVKERDNK